MTSRSFEYLRYGKPKPDLIADKNTNFPEQSTEQPTLEKDVAIC